MKISIFSAFYPFRGGIAQFNARFFRSLEKKNDVQAFTFKKQYPDFLFPGTSQFVTEQDKVDKLPAQRIVSTFNPFTYFKAAKAVRRSNPDLFIANYWMSFFALFLGVMAKKQERKTKKIAIIHNLIPHEPRFFDAWLNRFFLKNYQGFVVMSDSVEKDLLSMKPDAKYIRLEHPWYDHFGDKMNALEARKLLNVHADKKTILFFGLVRDYKGLDLLIEAFSHLCPEYQLIIAGEVYSNLKIYDDLIEKSGAKDRIFFFNKYIPDDEVRIYFSASDVCVLPYRTATQSGITATAFHFEVPLIATNVGGLSKSIGHMEKGLIVENVSAKALHDGMKYFFEKDLSEQLIKNIHRDKHVNSWDAFAEKLVDFSTKL